MHDVLYRGRTVWRSLFSRGVRVELEAEASEEKEDLITELSRHE